MKNELTIAFLLPERSKETPLQVDVFKAMTNQRAITIQISSPQDNQPDSTMIDTMIQSLKF